MHLNTKEFKLVLKKIKLGMKTSKMEATQYIYIKENRVYSYSDSYGVSATLPIQGGHDEKFECCVNGKTFMGAIDKIKTKEIELKVRNDQLTLYAGKKKILLPLVVDEYFIELVLEISDSQNSDNEWIDDDKDVVEHFIKGLIFTSSTASKDLNDGVFSTVFASPEYGIVASNKREIIRWLTDLEKFDSFKIYKDGVNKVKQMGAKNINSFCITDNWVHFRDNTNDLLSIRKISGNYPDLHKHLNGQESLEFFDFPDTNEVMDIIRTISGEKALIEVREGFMEVRTPAASLNTARESFKIDYKGSPFRIFVGINILTDLVKENVSFAKGDFFCIQHEYYDYMSVFNVAEI